MTIITRCDGEEDVQVLDLGELAGQGQKIIMLESGDCTIDLSGIHKGHTIHKGHAIHEECEEVEEIEVEIEAAEEIDESLEEMRAEMKELQKAVKELRKSIERMSEQKPKKNRSKRIELKDLM